MGRDAIPELDAVQLESGQGKPKHSTFAGGAERTQNLYFPVTLAPDRTNIGGDESLPLTNGMAVTVEIKTGDRRLIDYVLSPLVEVGSRVLKER